MRERVVRPPGSQSVRSSNGSRLHPPQREQTPVADHRPEAAARQAMVDLIQTSPRVAAQAESAAQLLPAGPSLAQSPANRTGLPDALKNGVEVLSGLDLSDVRVHANSDRPAQLNALAYAQGNEIHLAPGQEEHLPHEAWHIVQQRQGRVRPTARTIGGVAINNDLALEREADALGARALLHPADKRNDASLHENPGEHGLPPVAQLFTYSATVLTGNYNDHADAERVAMYAELRAKVLAFKNMLTVKVTALNTYLATLGIPAIDNTNRLFRKEAAFTNFAAALALAPAAADWQARKDSQLALDNTKDHVLAKEGFRDALGSIRKKLEDNHWTVVAKYGALLDQVPPGDPGFVEPYKTPLETFMRLEAEVGLLMDEVSATDDWTDLDAIKARIVVKEQAASQALDGPFAQHLAEGWVNNIPAPVDPRTANLYKDQHIMARHKRTSQALNASKFRWDTWQEIQAAIDAALPAGNLVGPVYNVVGNHPLGRFEITHNTGAVVGKTIAGVDTNSIKVIVTRSGRTVVTAYPL